MVNTGILKLNTSGANKDNRDATSYAAPKDKEEAAAIQKERLEKGNAARLIDESYVTHASTKEKLDESYRSDRTVLT